MNVGVRRGADRMGLVSALVLAASTLLPWYTLRALVDVDRYVGNPIAPIDWVVLVVALLSAFVVRVRIWAGAVGLISVAVTLLLLWGDAAEGVSVRPNVGLLVALASSVGHLWAHRHQGSFATVIAHSPT